MSEAPVVAIDFTGVSSGFEAMPIGNYRSRIQELPKVEPSKKSGEMQVNFVFEVVEPGYEERKLFHHCSLQPQALWKLRKTLEALGVEVPNGPMTLDLQALVGRECYLQVGQEEYKGQMKNTILELISLEGDQYPGEGSMQAPM